MNKVIIDTGPVVALLDRDEQNHAACLDFFRQFKGKFFSTEAVLTEAMYLLNESVSNQKKCAQFFLQAITLIPASPAGISRSIDLMEKYHDIPMDYADATLTFLAEDMACPDIFTLDRRGFETFRWGKNNIFKIFPER